MRKLKWLVTILVTIVVSMAPVTVLASNPMKVDVTNTPAYTNGISSFIVTYVSDTEMDLSWVMDTSWLSTSQNIMIRAKYGTYPADIPNENTMPSDGYLVFYGDGFGTTSVVDNSMNFDQNAGPLYYKAWAQKVDGTWYVQTHTNAQESREMILLAFIAVALVLTGFCFVWHNILLALAGMVGWLVLAGYIIFGGNPAIDTTTTWGLLLVFLFVILCFVPLVRFISMLGKTKVSHTDKTGKMWSLWEKPPKPKFVSSAEQTREKRRQEIRAAIDRAQTHRS